MTARVRVAALVALLIVPSCSASGLALRQDHRVSIVHPDDRSTVALPVTVRWTIRDIRVGPGAGSFGVYVDRAPQRPGKTQAWLFRNAADCHGPACLDEQYLTLRNVHHTYARTFTVDHVSQTSGRRGSRLHEVTIVLLDARGRRVGESAWSVQFRVEKAAP